MLKLYSFIAILLLIGLNARSQIVRRFLDTNRNITLDSTKARFYLITQKLDQDSAYLGNVYNLRGNILSTGSYKDDYIKVPHSKFTFYGYGLKFNKDSTDFEMYQYISTIGYYNNGIKNGPWTDFYFDGYKAVMNEYENDKLNGKHERYNWTGSVLEKGNYVNDLKEGEWKVFNGGGALLQTDVYKDNVVTKPAKKKTNAMTRFIITHVVTPPRPDFDINLFLTKCISNQIPYGVDGVVVLRFTVDKIGKISGASVARGLSDVVDKAVLKAILSGPDWKPAVQNAKPIDNVVFCPVTLVNSRATTRYISAYDRYDPYY